MGRGEEGEQEGGAVVCRLACNENVSSHFVSLNGRGALAENPEVTRAVGERDREGRERLHCLPAILFWNQF